MLASVYQELIRLLPDLPGRLGPRWAAFRRRLQGLLVRAAHASTEVEVRAILDDLAALFGEYGLVAPEPHWPTWPIPKTMRGAETLTVKGQESSPVSPTDLIALAQALAARVARYVDVYCPRQVALDTMRFPVIVKLTVQPEAASAVAQHLLVWPGDEPVVVVIRPDPAGLAVPGPDTANLTVLKDRDSPPVTFYLQPLRVGAWDVTLEFHQQGRRLGAVTVRPEVIVGRATDAPLPRPKVSIGLSSDYLPVPDVDLRIRCRDQGGPVVLEFEVNSPLLNYHAYRSIEPLTLTASPAQWQASTFARLSEMAASGAGDGLAGLKRIGQRIYRELFPPGLQALYRELRQHPGATVLITSDEPWIPWELAWPYEVPAWEEEAPLGVRYQVGRWLASGRSDPYDDLRVSAVACVAPAGSGLPSVRQELQLIQALAGGRVMASAPPARTLRGPIAGAGAGLRLRDLTPPRATRAAVWALLEGDCDLLHFAGHGQFEPDPYQSALRLEDGKLLAGDIVGLAREGAIQRNRPLVFLNACEVGRVGYGLTGIGGWARAFVEPGCGAFIGPLWEVEDRMAAAFATAFYRAVQAQSTLGEAVAAARQECRQADADNPTWLAYLLYGHPAARVHWGE